MASLEDQLQALQGSDGPAADVSIAARVEHRIARQHRFRLAFWLAVIGIVGAIAGWLCAYLVVDGLDRLTLGLSAMAIEFIAALLAGVVCATIVYACTIILAAARHER